MRKMTGYAPLNAVYMIAGSILFPGSMILTMTRVKYATLAEMARHGGDLAFKDVGRRLSRLKTLQDWGLVKRVPRLGRWELTANGWKLLTKTEEVYYLRLEEGGPSRPTFQLLEFQDSEGK